MHAALVQLSRIYGLELSNSDKARAAIAGAPAVLAAALFHEAADSDDVAGVASAMDYLDLRLAFLGELVPPDADHEVRSAFRDHVRAWEQ